MSSFKRLFIEAPEDQGAAMDAVDGLRDLVEAPPRDDVELGRKLVEWYKAYTQSIHQALGVEQQPVEAKKPKLGSGARFKKLEKQLATEAPAKSDVEKSDADLPSDVTDKLRQIIQSLESIVPDEDPEGDEAVMADDGVEEAVNDPAALAAWIGRKKYGKDKFQDMAAAGKRKK